MPPFFRRGLFLALAVLVTLPFALQASAQDKPDRAEWKAQRVERLTEALDLTAAQQQILTNAEAEPGASWSVAAALTPTLTAEQKTKLFTRPERMERPDRMQRDGKRGRRGERGQMQRDRSEKGEHLTDAQRAERREAHQAAMKAALNLSDAQVDQLEALHEAHKAEREARRAERQQDGQKRMEDHTPGELPADLAAILTPAQQEVFKVHRALGMRMHAGRMHHGRRGPTTTDQ